MGERCLLYSISQAVNIFYEIIDGAAIMHSVSLKKGGSKSFVIANLSGFQILTGLAGFIS